MTRSEEGPFHGLDHRRALKLDLGPVQLGRKCAARRAFCAPDRVGVSWCASSRTRADGNWRHGTAALPRLPPRQENARHHG
jgi:hypothetical protein